MSRTSIARQKPAPLPPVPVLDSEEFSALEHQVQLVRLAIGGLLEQAGLCPLNREDDIQPVWLAAHDMTYTFEKFRTRLIRQGPGCAFTVPPVGVPPALTGT